MSGRKLSEVLLFLSVLILRGLGWSWTFFFAKGFCHNKGLCGKKLPRLFSSPTCLVSLCSLHIVQPCLLSWACRCPLASFMPAWTLSHPKTELWWCMCRTAGISLALERSQQELHAAMKRCFAVVNSSLSEGMSATILEVNIFRPHRYHVNSFNTTVSVMMAALWCRIMWFDFHQSRVNIYNRPYRALSVSATVLSVCSRANCPN